jgi:hypothetical protein
MGTIAGLPGADLDLHQMAHSALSCAAALFQATPHPLVRPTLPALECSKIPCRSPRGSRVPLAAGFARSLPIFRHLAWSTRAGARASREHSTAGQAVYPRPPDSTACGAQQNVRRDSTDMVDELLAHDRPSRQQGRRTDASTRRARRSLAMKPPYIARQCKPSSADEPGAAQQAVSHQAASGARCSACCSAPGFEIKLGGGSPSPLQLCPLLAN